MKTMPTDAQLRAALNHANLYLVIKGLILEDGSPDERFIIFHCDYSLRIARMYAKIDAYTDASNFKQALKLLNVVEHQNRRMNVLRRDRIERSSAYDKALTIARLRKFYASQEELEKAIATELKELQ